MSNLILFLSPMETFETPTTPKVVPSAPTPTAPEGRPGKKQLYHFVTRPFALLASWALIAYIAYAVGFVHGGSEGLGMTNTNDVPADRAVITNVTAPKDVTVDFSLFWRIWTLVKEKHIDGAKLDANKMLYGAINGMLGATGDPYTTFFDPEENKQFKEKIAGNFEGIGAEMGMKDDTLTIVAPLDDMPAQKAGLRAGDRILKIDGEDAAPLTLEQAVAKIRGPKGTEVKLTIFRDGDADTSEVTVKRDTIVVKTVKVEYKDNNIAVIRISQFGDTTTDEFNQVAKEVAAKHVRGIVIDLRSDPGGLLDSAVALAGSFVPKGNTVVMEEDASGKRDTLSANGNDLFGATPIAILIDGGSASASEILAGALKDDRPNDVTLVGTKSFGKGSVQELMPVTNNTSLKITVAHWLTPSGKQINKIGITPDIEVKLTTDDITNKKDPQLDKALEVLAGKTN